MPPEISEHIRASQGSGPSPAGRLEFLYFYGKGEDRGMPLTTYAHGQQHSCSTEAEVVAARSLCAFFLRLKLVCNIFKFGGPKTMQPASSPSRLPRFKVRGSAAPFDRARWNMARYVRPGRIPKLVWEQLALLFLLQRYMWCQIMRSRTFLTRYNSLSSVCLSACVSTSLPGYLTARLPRYFFFLSISSLLISVVLSPA